MLMKALLAIFGLFASVVIALVFLPTIVNKNEALRTDPRTSTGLQCATGSGTSCSITLPSAHEYADTSFMTVTETNPGSSDRTATSTVSANRLSVTVSGLSSSTTYTFNVAYSEKAANISEGLNDGLKLSPLIIVAGIVVIAVLAGGGAIVVAGARA